MKKTISLFAWIVLLGLQACSSDTDEPVVVPDNPGEEPVVAEVVPQVSAELAGLSLVSSRQSETATNPTLLDSWETAGVATLNTQTGNRRPKVTLPCSGTSFAGQFQNQEDYLDVRKADGWRMLFHTFSEQCAEGQNYICFYNDRTSRLKVWYYYEGGEVPGSKCYWCVKAVNADHSDFVEQLDCTSLDASFHSDTQLVMQTIFKSKVVGNIYGLSLGWTGLEFYVPREVLTEDVDICIGPFVEYDADNRMFRVQRGARPVLFNVRDVF